MQSADTERNEELRRMLIELRDEILSRIAQEMGTKSAEDPRMSRISAMDIGDLSQQDLDGDIDYSILNMHVERLRNVEHALDRLEEGNYGYCEDCGRTIRLERMRVLPFTKYCIRCQEKREQMGQESKLKKMRKGDEFEL